MAKEYKITEKFNAYHFLWNQEYEARRGQVRMPEARNGGKHQGVGVYQPKVWIEFS